MNTKQLNEAIAVIENAIEETDQHVNEHVHYIINYIKQNKDDIMESTEYYNDFDMEDDNELF
jgi:hypothetical protein